ncbi:MAG: tetratricopeptide repeat protein [Thermodesulfobacteriota bacterium]
MKYDFSGLPKPRRRVTTVWFFSLILSVIVISGCTVLEKTPEVEESFFLERAGEIRKSADEAYAEGHYQRALSMYREAYEIDIKKGRASDRVSDLIGMGRSNTGLGRTSEAERHLTRAVEAAFSSRDESVLSAAYGALAGLYLKTGDTRLAMVNIKDALRLQGTGRTPPAALLNLAGLIYIKAGKLDEAAAALEKAISAVQQEQAGRPSPALADSYRIMAAILAETERRTEAILYFKRAYDIDTWLGDDRKRALDLWGYAGLLFDSKRYDEAAEKLKMSYRLNMKSGSLEGAIRDLDKLVEVYMAMGDKRSESYYRTMKEAVLSDMR